MEVAASALGLDAGGSAADELFVCAQAVGVGDDTTTEVSLGGARDGTVLKTVSINKLWVRETKDTNQVEIPDAQRERTRKQRQQRRRG